ncbi:MAG: YggS family pyridoxal phosphate enzyme [Candidatus Omnitrophica bacterium CG1_02_44_16]|nr:MAG: YggS family pyridoxal phosphate enzyme [Candidatus Omnitrophica bacterium CG1_02_44_16]PIY83672.1 MAG: YggS family pyridoxal phosphate-dependent enzyme [Candidatus Omnitrophica bacterium CG_4_10_14_0_8_um_filter_44_12]PIZ84430.1 MAG: YggS family pyridoxal phosphate-dependent enzyme [Candidatus Omnitrophica bacterium CG_4_10_14_0_2_um_filter_44_9]
MVRENLAFCLKRIEAVTTLAGASSLSVTLVAVTKSVPLLFIYEAIDCGVMHIAENRIQEAILKYDPVCAYASDKGVVLKWHMIGHLQTNKVKDAVRIFDLIHSVDSLKVAFEINKEAGKMNKVQDALIEVKTSAEVTKYGFAPEEVSEAVKEISIFKNIKVKGLMTIAPIVDTPEKARPYFRKLRDLSSDLFVCRPSSVVCRPILSMGMTDDFEAAVQEGANMVRIGRGIFSERPKI